MPDQKRKVAVFLGSPSAEGELQQYAQTNGLEILYSFNRKSDSAAPPPIAKEGLGTLSAIVKGKRRVDKSLFMGIAQRLRESVGHPESKHPFGNRSFQVAGIVKLCSNLWLNCHSTIKTWLGG